MRVLSPLKQFEVIQFYLPRCVCVCQYNKNIIYRRVQGVCLSMWAGDGLCLQVCVVWFFFSLKAKKAKKIHSVFVCRAGWCGSLASPLLHSCVSSLLPPAANHDGSNGGNDIWEQFLSAPAKVVKGLISSHAGAQEKKRLPPRIKHNLLIKTSLSGWETSINNISSVQIR